MIKLQQQSKVAGLNSSTKYLQNSAFRERRGSDMARTESTFSFYTLFSVYLNISWTNHKVLAGKYTVDVRDSQGYLSLLEPSKHMEILEIRFK